LKQGIPGGEQGGELEADGESEKPTNSGLEEDEEEQQT
jgi:hypothetical protein